MAPGTPDTLEHLPMTRTEVKRNRRARALVVTGRRQWIARKYQTNSNPRLVWKLQARRDAAIVVAKRHHHLLLRAAGMPIDTVYAVFDGLNTTAYDLAMRVYLRAAGRLNLAERGLPDAIVLA